MSKLCHSASLRVEMRVMYWIFAFAADSGRYFEVNRRRDRASAATAHLQLHRSLLVATTPRSQATCDVKLASRGRCVMRSHSPSHRGSCARDRSASAARAARASAHEPGQLFFLCLLRSGVRCRSLRAKFTASLDCFLVTTSNVKTIHPHCFHAFRKFPFSSRIKTC